MCYKIFETAEYLALLRYQCYFVMLPHWVIGQSPCIINSDNIIETEHISNITQHNNEMSYLWHVFKSGRGFSRDYFVPK